MAAAIPDTSTAIRIRPNPPAASLPAARRARGSSARRASPVPSPARDDSTPRLSLAVPCRTSRRPDCGERPLTADSASGLVRNLRGRPRDRRVRRARLGPKPDWPRHPRSRAVSARPGAAPAPPLRPGPPRAEPTPGFAAPRHGPPEVRWPADNRPRRLPIAAASNRPPPDYYGGWGRGLPSAARFDRPAPPPR